MKNILLSIIAVFVLCITAQAQTPTYAPQTLVSHVAITASTATNLNVVIDCRKQASITLMVNSSNTVNGLTGDGTGSLKLFCQKSVDGTTYETTGFTLASSVAPAGFTAVNWFTNIASQGCGYIKLVYATNTMAATTNIGDLNIAYGVKISAP